MAFTISTLDCPNKLKQKLKDSVGISTITDENQINGQTLFYINLEKIDYNVNLKENLANIIAEIIIDKLENKLIDKIIDRDYSKFNKEEQERIKKFTLEHLEMENQNSSKMVRKKEIVNQIFNYLDQHNNLNIEGFVRFRLKDYINRLKLAVEKSVDDYIIDKEYNEFVKLLQYFVDLQEPRINQVNVIKEKDCFKLLDAQKRDINSQYLENCIQDYMDEDVESEDLLISALINLSPSTIILHFDDEEVEETLRNIFGDRIIIKS